MLFVILTLFGLLWIHHYEGLWIAIFLGLFLFVFCSNVLGYFALKN